MELASERMAAGNIKPEQVESLQAQLADGVRAASRRAEAVKNLRVGVDPASIVLQAGRDISKGSFFGLIFGVLLLGAACAVVISTGMNYLLSPSTNIMRDIYQRFLKPDATQKQMIALQKVFICILGVCAFLMIFIPTYFGLQISVLRYSYFAYTMYGVVDHAGASRGARVETGDARRRRGVDRVGRLHGDLARSRRAARHAAGDAGGRSVGNPEHLSGRTSCRSGCSSW